MYFNGPVCLGFSINNYRTTWMLVAPIETRAFLRRYAIFEGYGWPREGEAW